MKTVGTYVTREEAEAVRAEMMKRPATPYQDSTLAKIHAIFLESREYKGRSDKARELYDLAWKYLKPLWYYKIAALYAQDFQNILDKMADDGLSQSMLEKERTLISKLYRTAIGWRVVDANLASVLKVEGRKSPEREIFTDEQITLILSQKNTPTGQMVIALLACVNANLLEINQAKSRINQAKKEGTTPDPKDLELVKTEKQNAFAISQYTDIMTIEKFAKHITSHGSVYSRADISAILYIAVDCMREMLLEGKKIRLGDLGDFSLLLTSKGAEDADKFTAQNITGVKVQWEPGQEFKNLRDDAEFNLVASRSAQAAVIKAIKEGKTNVDLNAPTTPDNTPGGSTPGGSNTGQTGSDGQGSESTGGTSGKDDTGDGLE